MKSILEDLAAWAVSTTAIPDAVAHAARRVLMDQVGVSVAGGKALPTLARGKPSARLWTTGDPVHASDAALANRFAGDDLELTAGPEIGAAGVAASEVAGSTLGELFVAMAIGSELESYLRGWLQIAVERHGLHPPAVFGAFAATAVAGKLLSIDERAYAGALAAALALTPHSPYAAFSEGATGKWLYGAWSQRLGVQCALWARSGMIGALSTLEGKRGVAQALLHGLSAPPDFRRDTSALLDVTFKAFPCSRACHPALTALEKLQPIDAHRIDRIEIWSYPFSVELEERSTKANAIASQMSISATLAHVLGVDVPIVVHAEGDDRLPRQRRARVRVAMKDGTVREASAEAKWSASRPATDAELRERFLNLTENRGRFDPWDASESTPVRDIYRG